MLAETGGDHVSMNLQADVVIDALRTVLGSSITVESAAVAIRHTPETDLDALPNVSATNYPLIALEVVDEGPSDDDGYGDIKHQAQTVTIALHFVGRNEDIAASTETSPRKYARKAAEAIAEKIAGTPQLGLSDVLDARFDGTGQSLEAKDHLRGQGLVEHAVVYSFIYSTDRV